LPKERRKKKKTVGQVIVLLKIGGPTPIVGAMEDERKPGSIANVNMATTVHSAAASTILAEETTNVQNTVVDQPVQHTDEV
jgi:hypothetical protein